MVPSYLFNDFESKPIVLIVALFCNEDEKVSKQLLKNLKAFTKKQKNKKQNTQKNPRLLNCLENKKCQTDFSSEKEKPILCV